MDKLPNQNHKILLLCNPDHAEKIPNYRGCDHWTELITSKDRLYIGPLYQLSLKEENILQVYLEKMIPEGTIPPSSSFVGSLILFVPKLNVKELRLCVNYQHMNDYITIDKTPLRIMDEHSQRLCNV
jgi:hypothetical protein